MKNLRKKLETGVDLRLSYAVASSDLKVKVIMCPLFLSTSDYVKERYCYRWFSLVYTKTVDSVFCAL